MSKQCPVCGYANISSAAHCQSCQASFAPKKKDHSLPLFIFGLACLFGLLAALVMIMPRVSQTSAQSDYAKTTGELPRTAQARRDYARGLTASATANNAAAGNVEISTAGADDEQIVITADYITVEDCARFWAQGYGDGARAIGFTSVTCRNRKNGLSWSYP